VSDQSAPVIVNFTLTQAEFTSAWRALCTRRWRETWRLPLLGLAAAFLGVVDSVTAMVAIGAAITIFFLLATYVIVPRDMWRRAEHGPQRHTFSEHEVTTVLPDSESRYDWRHWREIAAAGDSYVLRSERGYNVIPRRAFTSVEDEQRFRLLTARIDAKPEASVPASEQDRPG